MNPTRHMTLTLVRRQVSAALVQKFVEGRKAEVSDPDGESSVDDTVGRTQVAVELDVRVVDVAHSLQHG